MFLIAASMAVAVVPEGLPAIATIALALAAQRMLERQALIRRLSAVESPRSVTVICTDKTGTLTLPDGRALLRGVSLELASGESMFISGPSGSGKSAFLLAIAGLWPFGCGTVTLGRGPILFVRQRPYLPFGTLAGAVLYPDRDKNSIAPAQLATVLRK